MKNGIEWRRSRGKSQAYAVCHDGPRLRWLRLPADIQTQRQAETARRQILDERKRQALSLQKSSSAPASWIDVATAIIHDTRLSGTPARAETLELWARDFAAIIGDCAPYEITPDDVRRIQTQLHARQNNASTIRKKLSFLRRILRTGAAPLWRDIALPREPVRITPYLSPDQASLLLDAAPPHRRLRYVLLLYTGMRRGELQTVTYADIDLKAAIIRVRNAAKGAGPRLPYRTVPLAPIARDALKSAPAGDPVDPLPLGGTNNWRRDFRIDCRAAAIGTEWRIHDLRHTYASWLAQRGVPLIEISRLLGHANIQMTMRYAHLAPEHDPRVLVALADATTPPPAKVENVQ